MTRTRVNGCKLLEFRASGGRCHESPGWAQKPAFGSSPGGQCSRDSGSRLFLVPSFSGFAASGSGRGGATRKPETTSLWRALFVLASDATVSAGRPRSAVRETVSSPMSFEGKYRECRLDNYMHRPFFSPSG